MMYYFLLFSEILILFFLSRSISKVFSRFFSVGLISLLFLPGVIIHELSHLLVASVLFVPVGGMEFVPKKHGESLKLGSVAIGKTDPIRRCIIGFAPIAAGLLFIFIIVYLAGLNISLIYQDNLFVGTGLVILITYLLFAVGNTMFSSRRDMEGAIEILLSISVLTVISYFFGIKIPAWLFGWLGSRTVLLLVEKAALFLMAPIIIDLFILVIVVLIGRRIQRRQN